MAYPIRVRRLTIGLDAVCLFVPFQPSHIASYLSPLCAALGVLFFFFSVKSCCFSLPSFLSYSAYQFFNFQFVQLSTRSAFQLQPTFQLRSTPQLHIFLSYGFSKSPKCATLPSCGTVATTLFLLTACARIATSSTSMSRTKLPPTGPTTNAFFARSLDRLNSTS